MGQLKVILAGESCRLLGANLNKDMTWKHQTETGEKAVLPALRSIIGRIKFISHNIPTKSILLLANGLVISKVLYLLTMWGGLSNTDCRKFQTLLNTCARVITKKPRNTQTRMLMVECNWLYFKELVIFHSLLMMWKLVILKSPYYLSKAVVLGPDNRITSKKGCILLVRNSFIWRSTTEWNSLPENLREIRVVHVFKRELKKHIIDLRPPVLPHPVPIYWD